jgi:adenylate cyclase
VNQLPDHLAELPHVEITQGYLAFDERGLEVRLRKVGEARYLAHKVHRGDTRIEREITLSDDQFDELWPATKGRRLRKVRYFVPHDGLTLEIDLYKGSATGIMVAEVEFPDRRHESVSKNPTGSARTSPASRNTVITFWQPNKVNPP